MSVERHLYRHKDYQDWKLGDKPTFVFVVWGGGGCVLDLPDDIGHFSALSALTPDWPGVCVQILICGYEAIQLFTCRETGGDRTGMQWWEC